MVYAGIPAALMDRCVVRDVAINTAGDLVLSRNLWKQGQEICAARVDAIRDHDAKARAAVAQ